MSLKSQYKLNFGCKGLSVNHSYIITGLQILKFAAMSFRSKQREQWSYILLINILWISAPVIISATVCNAIKWFQTIHVLLYICLGHLSTILHWYQKHFTWDVWDLPVSSILVILLQVKAQFISTRWTRNLSEIQNTEGK